ncbi:MAG TPA: FmdE family protein [Candidatus Ozemobacteraceae bacterium]|nr:FmdE family protein [Candidatus Ozemobacteraceae bacterium]
MNDPETFEQAVERVFAFHTKRAPGIYIGVAMVRYALEALGSAAQVGKLNAVCETSTCLPDCLQVLIGCTVGVRYLKIHDEIGRYALTIYSRESGQGIRVFVDLDKIDSARTPELYNFFYRTRSLSDNEAREASGRKVIEEFAREGRKVLGLQRVRLREFGKTPILPARRCPICRESYLIRDEKHDKCDYCSGLSAYYALEN